MWFLAWLFVAAASLACYAAFVSVLIQSTGAYDSLLVGLSAATIGGAAFLTYVAVSALR